MVWLEFNIHMCHRLNDIKSLFANAVPIILDFVEPFINSQRDRFSHWHYLFEPDVCRGQPYGEIRLRIESDSATLERIKSELITMLDEYSVKTGIVMRESQHLGSHDGCHGRRGECYLGQQSENFGRDWDTIIEIMQRGSENAIEILRLGRNLVEERSLEWGGRERTYHPYYLHLSANQLLVEP